MITIAEAPSHRIDRRVYGQFAEHLGRCIYEGLWVGRGFRHPEHGGIRNDVVEALRAIKVPVVRWPGGCFADEYHWRDGIGPRAERPPTVNTHWGGVVETNAFGTHEFLELLRPARRRGLHQRQRRQRHARGMADWVEYMTLDSGLAAGGPARANGRDQSRCGSSSSASATRTGAAAATCGPMYYADLYRRYADLRAATTAEQPISKIACGGQRRRLRVDRGAHGARGAARWTA